MNPEISRTHTEISEPFSFKIPHSFTIKGKEISIKEAKWYIFYGFVVIGLITLLCIILYVEVYINSFLIRVDCNPDMPLNYEKCLDRGCIWVQRTEELQPLCFYPDGYGYVYQEVRKTSNGYHVDLERTTQMKMFGAEVDSISLQVYFETEKRLRLKFADKAKKRFEVPIEVPLPPAESPSIADYSIDFVNDPQFGVLIKRNDTGTVIFDTNIPGMIFSEQYIQISTRLASSNVYGFGEHTTAQHKHDTRWKKWSLFARDISTDFSSNLYGYHPFYMCVEEDGNTHGVFLLNSNAMEIIFQPAPAVTFRTIGGILDFYIFLGPSPEDVVKQYLEVIGSPVMPPYWALGFQLSRRGYITLDDVKLVTQRTEDANIPYDVQYLDIEYMNNFKDFTYDEKRYQHLPAFVDDLHEKGRKVVIVLNPGIASNKTLQSNYPALDVGINRDVFIKINGSYLEGKGWPGKTYFPDFSNPEVRPYWTQMCTEFRKFVRFDGLWLDMNEPSNFVDGSLTGCGKNLLNYPPYGAGIKGSQKDGKLFEKTICMDAVHEAGKHYDIHNLYGYFQANVTFRTLAIIIPGNRPMVVSRSTFPSSGRFTSHSLGDNLSTWEQLKASIPGILKFNLFGIPFVGANICGYFGNTTEELCLRWMQLGAFYPFSRNHNSLNSKNQDPASFGKSFVQLINRALYTRYELLPYLYTLFHLAHTEGSTVARPILHEFPKDPKTWDISYQFLWGAALLISPFLEEGESVVEAYIPDGLWYNYYKGNLVKEGNGRFITLMDEGQINLHVRGGYILPLQKPNVTTFLSRKQPMGLFVAPNENGSATGLLFWDDGISYETQEHRTYLQLGFYYQESLGKSVLTSNITINSYPDGSYVHFGYMIFCKQKKPSKVVLNDENLGTKWTYDGGTQVLRIDNLDISIADAFQLIIE
ncbi:sucrase-isomaltase, intestinal-like [Uloborus diversus]|uniref:sucrase-isomaltase, intestinal-like n=1 Tax=Uloborus diversus TaxID=327109 RepID=UPI0024090993|nr:sucrase-isomaltase, intestinal-like [Uloborus diversus]